MTTYLSYIRALKAGIVINDYNYTPALERLATMNHVFMRVVLPDTGKGYREYSYEPPVVTVADAPPLAVVAPVNAANLVGTEVHLWNDYPTGKKPTMGKWKVTARLTGDWYTLEYKPTAKTVTRTRAQLCTPDEYAAYVAGVKAAA